MNIIYSEYAEDVIVASITLNGLDGAIAITDSNDDLDVVFEDVETAQAWLKMVYQGLEKIEKAL